MENLKPPEGKALVYIARPAFFGKLIQFKTFCGDELIGYTVGKSYLHTFLDPGTHNLMSMSENKSFLEINVEANKTYYVKQKVSFGFIKARNKLLLLNETEGEYVLSKCKPSKLMAKK